jgi:hypothetical protein
LVRAERPGIVLNSRAAERLAPSIPDANASERLVRAEGLEPPQLSSLEPKSSASTSSATPALLASSPAAMHEHDAEKCEAVFGRPSCSKLMESIRFVTWRSQIKNLIVARAYNMGLRLRSKKMAHLGRFATG